MALRQNTDIETNLGRRVTAQQTLGSDDDNDFVTHIGKLS